MMCTPCKDAGRVLTCDQSVTPEELALYHEHCEAPVTCTCQHGTVSVLDVLLREARDVGWAGKGFTRKYSAQ